MGYQITYTLKEEELSSEFKPIYNDSNKLDDDINSIKLELELIALSPFKETNISNLIKDVNFKTKQYLFLLKEKAKYHIYNTIKNEGEIYFCGWQYSQTTEYDKQTIIDSITENICIQKLIVTTPDYFDDCEKFNQKRNEISMILDYEDIIFEMLYSEFKEKYYEKSDEYNSSIKDVEGVKESEE